MGSNKHIDEKEISVNLLYLALHNLLVRKVGINKVMTQKQLFCILGRHFLIPKNLKPIILIEMENMGLIEKIDRYEIKILKSEFDLEKDAKAFYEWAGIYDTKE